MCDDFTQADDERALRAKGLSRRDFAGMAAAVSGALSSLMAIVLGGFAARQYDGTLTPVALSFVIFAVGAWAASEWAERNRPVAV